MKSVDFNLAKFLPYRLAVLSERASRRLSVVYETAYGLSVAEWRILVHLGRSQPVSVREIHTCVNLEKSRVSRAVTRLEAEGLVEKTPGSVDARLVEISLTEKGKTALADILPQAMQVERSLTSGLTEAELDTFSAIMEKIHTAMDSDPLARPRLPRDTSEE